MDAAQSGHPTRKVLSSFGLGKLDDRSAQAVSNHIEQCPECRQQVAEMSADSFLGHVRDAQGLAMSTYGQSQASGSASGQAGPKAVAPPPTATLPPCLVDHADYEIKRELGRGGMGVVYLAHNRLMGRDEVLKVMARHIMERPGVLERFLREIRAVAKLRHSNIVTAYHATRLGDSVVFAMEYVDGLDLSRMVKVKGPLPVSHACNFVYQASLGLQHAHEEGLVHRDIKPGNLMLARKGNKATIKILDFGLAKAARDQKVDGTLTSEGQALGTPDFIAPEQIVNCPSVDIRADIYSLGGTLYYLLTARPPFQANSLYDIYQAHISRDADPLNLIRPDVPVELAAMVAKMMAKEPERRFQTPKQVAEALGPFFKSGSELVTASKVEISRAERTEAPPPGPRPVSTSLPSMTNTKRPALAGTPERATEGALGPASESVTEAGTAEPWASLAPAVDALQRPPRKKWPIAVAASLLALVALGAIIITIRDKNGNEISRIVVPEGSTVVIDETGEKGKTKPAETKRLDPVNKADRVGGPGNVAPPTVPSDLTDALRPGTSWSGTSTVLFRSWANGPAKPRPLRLTIKKRPGSHLRAVAESPRGLHDAEGTVQDGVVNWRVATENLSWEGKLDGKELVGEFKGTNWQGQLSGEFRLVLADGLQPRAVSTLVPPLGPARCAGWVQGDGWTVEGNQLVKEGLGDGYVQFGDSSWTDYDLSFEVQKTAGPHGIGCGYRISEGRFYWLGFGDPQGNHSIGHWNAVTREPTWPHVRPGTINSLQWYTVKVILRGQHTRIELDDQVLFDCIDDFSPKGLVALRFYDSAGRFRNVKVTAPDGTVLWEGLPDLH
jgi:serine/threonine protein kinase